MIARLARLFEAGGQGLPSVPLAKTIAGNNYYFIANFLKGFLMTYLYMLPSAPKSMAHEGLGGGFGGGEGGSSFDMLTSGVLFDIFDLAFRD